MACIVKCYIHLEANILSVLSMEIRVHWSQWQWCIQQQTKPMLALYS